jgi:hypothetical protein
MTISSQKAAVVELTWMENSETPPSKTFSVLAELP